MIPFPRSWFLNRKRYDWPGTEAGTCDRMALNLKRDISGRHDRSAIRLGNRGKLKTGRVVHFAPSRIIRGMLYFAVATDAVAVVQRPGRRFKIPFGVDKATRAATRRHERYSCSSPRATSSRILSPLPGQAGSHTQTPGHPLCGENQSRRK